jgi:hypothetical protein
MLHSPLTSPVVYGNHDPMDLINEASQNIADRLTWHTANRDQAGIAKNLADGQDIPEVYGLGEAGLFDEFFYFLDHLGFKEGRQPTKIRGPVCPNFIASSIAAITALALERLFNRAIAILAANSFFPKKVNALLYASEIQSTWQW